MNDPGESFQYDYTPRASLFEDDLSTADLFEILATPWFSRVWVFQEAVLSPKAVCYWGDWRVNWDHICRMGRWLYHELYRSHSVISEVEREGKTFESAYSGIKLTLLADGYKYTAAGTKLNALTLSALLTELSPELEATDHRDRFYGVLGLFDWSTTTGPIQWLKVDYTRSVLEVSRDATRAAILNEGDLSIIEQCDLVHVSQRPNLEGYGSCSWVYELRRKDHIWPHRQRFREETKCADRPIHVQGIVPSKDERLLFLQGYKVSQVSVVLTSEVIGSSCNAESLGGMIDDVVHCLVNMGRPHLIQKLMATIGMSESVSMPGSTFGWIKLADSFIVFCKRRHNASSDLGTRLYSTTTLGESFEAMIKGAIDRCAYRRFFLTADGRLALGHEWVKANDCVAVLFGGSHPFILRSANEHAYPLRRLMYGSARQARQTGYRLVGLAHVPGIMEGEVVNRFEKDGVEPETFCLW